jgi:hypothetical protein
MPSRLELQILSAVKFVPNFPVLLLLLYARQDQNCWFSHIPLTVVFYHIYLRLDEKLFVPLIMLKHIKLNTIPCDMLMYPYYGDEISIICVNVNRKFFRRFNKLFRYAKRLYLMNSITPPTVDSIFKEVVIQTINDNPTPLDIDHFADLILQNAVVRFKLEFFKTSKLLSETDLSSSRMKEILRDVNLGLSKIDLNENIYSVGKISGCEHSIFYWSLMKRYRIFHTGW